MRRSLTFTVLALIGVSFGFAGRAVAKPEHQCGDGDGPWVSVVFDSGTWQSELKQMVLADLKVELYHRGISVCHIDEAPTRPALAAITISSSAMRRVSVTVEIRDAVTDKRVTRDVELEHIPPDGRALTVALAADELVWASWAELALQDNQRRAQAPAPVVHELERRLMAPVNKNHRLGLGLGAEHYTGRLTLVGADVLYKLHVTPRFVIGFAPGLRQGFDIETLDGIVHSTAIGLGMNLEIVVLHSRGIDLTWGLGSRVSWLRFEATANEHAVAASFSGLALFARTGVQAQVLTLEPFWLGLSSGVGVPVRAIEATDAGSAVVGMSGLELAAQLSAGGEL